MTAHGAPGMPSRSAGAFTVPDPDHAQGVDSVQPATCHDSALDLFLRKFLSVVIFSRPQFFAANPRDVERHLSGKGAWKFHLWDILMFEMWLRENNRVSRAGETVDAPVPIWRRIPLRAM